MYSPKAITAVTAATLWLAAATANAAPFASDDFAYPNGNLAGSTGGTGWGAAWANVSGSQATVASEAATFTYTGNPGSESSRSLPAVIGAGTTTWIRFHGRMTSSASTNSSYGGLGLYEGTTERLLIGKDWPGTEQWKLSARDSGGTRTYAQSLVSISDPGLDDIWLKIVNGAGTNDDSVSLWINPADTSSEGALGTAIGTQTGRHLNFDKVRLRGGTGGGNTETWAFDNLKLGLVFGDVSGAAAPPAPLFSMASGTYYGATTVMLSSIAGSTIHYTTNNTVPTTASPAGIAGSGAATVLLDTPGTVTLRALAVLGDQNSPVSEANYVIILGDGVWVDDLGGNWTDAANWVGANIAAGANRTASFPATLTADATATLNSDITIGNLLFGGGGAPDARWIIAGSKMLTFSGTSPAITTAADTAAAITCVISGSNGLTKGGDGILTLTSTANTYTGGTTVNDGILELGGPDNGQSRVGSGPLTINAGAAVHAIAINPLGWNNSPTNPEVKIQGGTFDSRTYASSFRKLTMNGGILTRSASHWYAGQADNEIHATGGTPLISGGEFRLRPATGATDLPVIVDENTTLTISSTLANDTYGSSGIVKSGIGTLALSGNNTYSSNTRVTGGTLVVSGSLASTTKIQVEPGATLELAAVGVLHLNPTRSVQVNGEAALHGTFDINLAAVTPANGGEWTIVEAAQDAVVTYAESFSVTGFDPSGSGLQRVWNRSTPGWKWTFSQQTGILSVAAADGYASWALANGVVGGINADDDNDGVPNGIEFFLGDTSNGFTTLPALNASTVSWPKGLAYTGVYGTDYVVETSGDLTEWKPVAVDDPNLAPNGVSYTLPGGKGKIFARLKVTGPL